MREKGLAQKARSLIFRRRMFETINNLEDEIRTYLLDKEKDKIITGGFRISVKEGGQIEVIELPPLNLEQMELPLRGKSRKESGDEITDLN